ncbi:short-chain collagen C4-like [Ostrea edulis]|uniref:short-chain collagen C4-like n=1 Tax=Ostrea edulis TaxID=37623 RepID=UPI0024AF9E2A|nr:short-chain collagen C4-like [Ostrea edulis]
MRGLLLHVLCLNWAILGWAEQDDRDRRLLLSDPQMIQAQLEAMQRRIQALETQATVRQTGSGAVYTIWGRRSCPLVNGTTTLYTGITSGKMYNMKGSGVTTLCLPHDPDSLPVSFHSPDDPYTAFIFGSEFEMNYKNVADNDDVPCAVCHAQTSTSALMIPAKLTCPQNWKLQYSGFMAAERYDYFASDFICVDLNPEYIEGTRAVNADGRLIHPVKARCGSLPCPPYKDKQYVSCVVCTN